MKIAIVLNGISRKKQHFYQGIHEPLRKLFDVSVFETQHAQHAIELASKATLNRFDCILAAGGDGTLNQVLNGIMLHFKTTPQLPVIGIVPLGTGNDFARLCNIKPNADCLLTLLKKNKPRPIDIGRLECLNENGEKVVSYFLNACSVGMGPRVVERLMTSNRSLGPLLTYLKAIIATFFTHRPQSISVITSHWQWNGKVRVLAIANGQSFGNAMYIAPDASPDDGIFSTFIAGQIPLLRFLLLLQKIKKPRKINDSLLFYDSCTMAEIKALERCAIEAEGELMGVLPAKVEVLPRQINFLR